MPMTVKRRAKKAVKRLRARAKRNKSLIPAARAGALEQELHTNPDVKKPTMEIIEDRPVFRTQRGVLKA